MKVDLPAPLSPSTQVTFPARTMVEMSDSEMTLPNVLVTFADLEHRCYRSLIRALGGGCSVTSTRHRYLLLLCSASRRTNWLASTASSSMAPTNVLNQSEFQLA